MDRELPLSSHIDAFRRMLVRIFLTWLTMFLFVFLFHAPILRLLTASITGGDPNAEPVFVLLSPLEGILITFKVAFWISLVGSSPLWLIFVGKFVLPALNPEEKRWAWPMLSLSLLFLFLGFFSALRLTIPWADTAFAKYNAELGVNVWSLSQYIDYALLMMLGHGILAEIAVVLFLFAHLGIFSSDFLREKRRHFIVGAFIVGALITPPDVMTQCAVAIPCCLFYEAAILYSRFRERRLRRGISHLAIDS